MRKTTLLLAFAVALFPGCTTSSTRKSAPEPTSPPPKEFEQTTLYQRLSEPSAIDRLSESRKRAAPQGRLAALTKTAGSPADLFTATVGSVDRPAARRSGVMAAELLFASLGSSDLDELTAVCGSRRREDGEVAKFGCPVLYVGSDREQLFTPDDGSDAALRQRYNDGFIPGDFDGSFFASLAALREGSLLEPLIPDPPASGSDASVGSSNASGVISLSLAGFYPNTTETSVPLAALSPDGTRLVTVFDDGGVNVLTLSTGAERTFRKPMADRYLGGIGWGSVSPDNATLVGVGETSLFAWDLGSDVLLAKHEFSGGRSNAASRITTSTLGVRWSPDRKYAITDAGLNTVVWDTTTWKAHRTHPAAQGASWSEDGTRYALFGIDDRPISGEIYEAESAVVDPPQFTDFQTAVFALDKTEPEREFRGPYGNGQFTASGNGIILIDESQSRDKDQLWNLSSNSLTDLKGKTDLSAGSTIVGFSFDDASGRTVVMESAYYFGWSDDAHRVVLADENGFYVYMRSDQPAG
jgi:hypothetical protein